MTPRLVPTPKRASAREGRLVLEAGAPVVCAPGADDREVLAAHDLAAEARGAGGALSVERMARLDGVGPFVLVAVAPRDRRLHPRVEALAKKLAKVPARVRDQAYALSVGAREALVVGAGVRGAFYGVQTLRQMLVPARGRGVALPRIEVVDWPDFPWRGVLLDVSRFKVPTLATLFEIVERLAHLKVNTLQFNMEHTFTYRRHPAIGAGCGSFTAEDIMAVDAFCRERCVEFQANLQSFGHCEHILTRPPYAHMAENAKLRPWSLSPAEAGTYRLLDDLYAEYLPCFASGLFNADCDETFDLGTRGSRSEKLAKRIGVGRVYLRHIKRINALARKHAKRMMIWGDIVLHYPDLIGEVPEDVILLNWGYGANDHRIPKTWEFARAGREHWVCPGTSAWQSIWPIMEKACLNIERFAAAGARTGASGLLNTDWGDHGHFQVQGGSFHGFAYGAEESWTAEPRPRASFDLRFAWAWFRDASGRFGRLWRALGETNAPFADPKRYEGRYDRMLFRLYFDRFPDGEYIARARVGDLARARRAAREALALVEKLRPDFPEHSVTLEEAELAAGQTLLAIRKAEVGKRVLRARKAGRRLGARLRGSVRDLAREWDRQRDEFERVWLLRARRSEIAYRLGFYRRGAREFARALRPRRRRK